MYPVSSCCGARLKVASRTRRYGDEAEYSTVMTCPECKDEFEAGI